MTPTARDILRQLLDNKFEAYYIGGCVRDTLLNKIPTDIDIVTSATPDEIISTFQDWKVDLVGKSFGVVVVGGIEVATYREDICSDSVKFISSLEKDVKRRDFTINSIAMDINGKIHDFNGGMGDLSSRIIRFIGDPEERIDEDPNRILRACRFKALVNGNFSGTTFDALKRNSTKITHVKRERIQKEIMRGMSTVKYASQFLISCYQIDILKWILPSLNSCMGVTQNKYHTEPLFTHSMIAGDSISYRYPIVKLAGYLHDIGKIHVKRFDKVKQDYTFIDHQKVGADFVRDELKFLKFSNDQIETVANLTLMHMRGGIFTPKASRKLLRDLGNLAISRNDLLRLKIGDAQAKFMGGRCGKFTTSDIRKRIEAYINIKRKEEPFSMKHLAIDGFQVMVVRNIKPSPEVGKILRYLLDKVVENPYLNTNEQLAKMVEEYHA